MVEPATDGWHHFEPDDVEPAVHFVVLVSGSIRDPRAVLVELASGELICRACGTTGACTHAAAASKTLEAA